MAFECKEDVVKIEQEMAWKDRDVPATTYAQLAKTAAAFPDRNAVSFQLFSGPNDPCETLSWAELLGQVSQAANMFRELGIGPSDVVAFLLPNSTETVLTYLGGQIAGIVNPVNPLLDAGQIAGILRETNAKVLVTLKSMPKSDLAQKAAEAVRQAENVQTILEVDLVRYLTGVKRLIVPLIRPKNKTKHHAKVLDFKAECQKYSNTLAFEDSTSDRVAAYFHTGGTTGTPKVVQHCYSGILYNAWLGDTLLFEETDVQLCPLPLFHVFASIVSLGASLASGAHVVFPTPQGYRGEGVFDNFWKLIERHKVSFVITVPTAISALMQRPVDADISSLRLAFCGSAPLPLELYKKFEEAAGVTICEGYGLTEATCLVSINPPQGEKRVGSIGLPFPYCEVTIRALSDGRECAVDEMGEICVCNPGTSKGHTYTETSKNENLYYPDSDGAPRYLRTGDLGRIDSDGYVWITGRAKDLIIRGGHNIDPADIEEVLAGHPSVALVGAIGQPDSHAGELPCAYVELVDGSEVSEDELMSYARQNMREVATCPKHIEILPELPKTAVGKIFKPDLRKRAITRVLEHAFAKTGIDAAVVSVSEHKMYGLQAHISNCDHDVSQVLDAYSISWCWAEAAEPEGASGS